VLEKLRDSAFEVATGAREIYKITVAEARSADTVERAAALWKETHAIYVRMLDLWKELDAILGRKEDASFVYCGDAIADLERESAEQYEFYAQSEQPKVKLTAVFEACEEGGYHAFIPEIRGVHTQGETIKEATENLVDALGLFLLDELEDKLSSIKPTNRIEVELTFSQKRSSARLETARA